MVEYLETGRWLSLSRSKKALRLQYKDMDLSMPVQKVERVMNGDIDRALFDKVVDDEFVATSVYLKRTKSGRGLLINDTGPSLITSKYALKRLLEDEVKGVKLGLVKEE